MEKVCILTSVHSLFDIRIFHKQAKTLAKAGYDVTLIVQHTRDEVIEGIKVIALPKPKNRFHRMIGLVFRVFRLALTQKADVYHFHDPELLPVGVLLRLFVMSMRIMPNRYFQNIIFPSRQEKLSHGLVI